MSTDAPPGSLWQVRPAHFMLATFGTAQKGFGQTPKIRRFATPQGVIKEPQWNLRF